MDEGRRYRVNYEFLSSEEVFFNVDDVGTFDKITFIREIFLVFGDENRLGEKRSGLYEPANLDDVKMYASSSRGYRTVLISFSLRLTYHAGVIKMLNLRFVHEMNYSPVDEKKKTTNNAVITRQFTIGRVENLEYLCAMYSSNLEIAAGRIRRRIV